jgi:hypothetical protein
MSDISSGNVGTEIPRVFMEVLTNFLNKICLDKVRRGREGWYGAEISFWSWLSSVFLHQASARNREINKQNI